MYRVYCIALNGISNHRVLAFRGTESRSIDCMCVWSLSLSLFSQRFELRFRHHLFLDIDELLHLHGFQLELKLLMPPRATLSNKREIRVAFRLHFGALPGKPGIPRILQRTPCPSR